MYGPDQQQKSSPNYNTEANISMIVEEAEKLYNKVIKDCTNKVIIDCTFSKSSLPSSLRLLPPSNEQQQSHMRSSPTAAAGIPYNSHHQHIRLLHGGNPIDIVEEVVLYRIFL
ncbi:MAG: hypothetical protein WA421_14690 [Nitrososphaeraceae archaeon]